MPADCEPGILPRELDQEPRRFLAFEREVADSNASFAKYAFLAHCARRLRSISVSVRRGSTSSRNFARKAARAFAVVSRGSWVAWRR